MIFFIYVKVAIFCMRKSWLRRHIFSVREGGCENTFRHASTRKVLSHTPLARLSSRTPVNQGGFMVYN